MNNLNDNYRVVKISLDMVRTPTSIKNAAGRPVSDEKWQATAITVSGDNMEQHTKMVLFDSLGGALEALKCYL